MENNALTLISTKTVVGVLETNIEQLETIVAEKLTAYNPESYEGDIKQAKADRAELNNSKKFLADARKRIIDTYMQPVRDFESRCKTLELNIDSVSKSIDSIVKADEEQAKIAKKALIQQVWESKNFKLFSLDKVLDKKWLNKTCKMTEIEKEIDFHIARTYKDLQTIERFADDAETIKAFYLDCLDIGSALDFGEQLAKNRQKVSVESETRVEREHEHKLEQQKKEILEQQADINKGNSISDITLEILADVDDSIIADTPAIKEYVVSFTCTESQMLGIKNYMTQQGITYSDFEEVSF